MGTLNSQRLIKGEGTSERIWQALFEHRPLERQKIDNLLGGSGVVHIVAPHPDDEILGCAGIIRQLSLLGIAIHVWAVTDGEASHPDSPHWARDVLATVRTEESERAMALICPTCLRKRLAMPDGAVARHEQELAMMLAESFAPGDTVFAPWRLDGHPDHEASARASHYAARLKQCRFLEVPIWGWHWADPYAGDFPSRRAVAIMLDPETQRLKAHAIQSFQSQLQPDPDTGSPAILPDYALARLQRPYEVVFQ